MKPYKIYNHLISTGIFGIKTKITNFRKPKNDGNKNRKRKD